jgi:uncharacterized protein with PIN domain
VVRPDPALWIFLAPARRRPEFAVGHDGTASLGHLVESVGVPLPEVGTATVDGVPVEPSAPLHAGAVVALAPPPRPQPLPDGTGFLLDVHLGTLARRLRLLGVDTAYRTDAADDELVEQAGRERRVLLTQDRRLLMRRALWAGAHVRGQGADAQLADVLDRFAPRLAPWTRCALCNGALVAVAKEEVLDRLEPGTRRRYDRFVRCTGCDRVYWHGAHGRRLDGLVAAAVTTVGKAAAARIADGRTGYGSAMMTARTLVQKYLMGTYPASRDELVDRAQREGADQGVVALVRHLPGERYESAVDVERALGHEH